MYQLFFIEFFNQFCTFWYVIFLYLDESKGEKIFPQKITFITTLPVAPATRSEK